MNLYTRKGDVKLILGQAVQVYQEEGLHTFIDVFHNLILAHKVKFPLLEFCAQTLYLVLPVSEHFAFCDEVSKRKTEGGNVILGIFMQLNLPSYFRETITKTTEYIADADEWYVCDIIGERVFGYSLLTDFERTFAEIERLSKHESNWVVRSLGAGSHYAIKKGLDKMNVDQLFVLLMTMTNTKDRQIIQGVGWAAKTTAKFHPDIITKYTDKIFDRNSIPNWFRSKIRIGLNRNKHAQAKRG